MGKYSRDNQDYYNDNYSTEIKPVAEDEFAFSMSKLRSKEQIDTAYRAISGAILTIYIFEAIFCISTPQLALDFLGLTVSYMWWLFILLLIGCCWVFNKYGLIKYLSNLQRVYGRAYYYKICGDNFQSYLDYYQIKRQ